MRKWAWAAIAVGMALAIAQPMGMSTTPQDKAFSDRIWKILSSQEYRFTWHYIPGKPAGFYRGAEPHGMVLRTFVNNIAFDAIQAKAGKYPQGAIVVKDNHMPSTALDAVTVMVKMHSGYDKDNGDWFYAKYSPSGKLDAAGKVPMCVQCHAQAKENDYVFSATIK